MNFYHFDSYGLIFMGRPLWQDGGSLWICSRAVAARPFLGPSPLRLAKIIYSLRFEASRFVASYYSHGHWGSIRPGLPTERNNGWMFSDVSTHELPSNRRSTFEWRHILRGGLFTERCVVTGWVGICDISRIPLCAINEFRVLSPTDDTISNSHVARWPRGLCGLRVPAQSQYAIVLCLW